MASVITCPKCSTRLKLNKVPAEATKIQCPHCHQTFAVAGSGVTARPPAPRAPAEQTPVPVPHSRAEGSAPSGRKGAPLIGTGAGIAIALAIVGVGAGGMATYIYTRPAVPVANTNDKPYQTGQDIAIKVPEDKKPAESTAEDKERIRKRHLERAEDLIKKRRFNDALADFNKVLDLFPDDPDARRGIEAAQKAKELEDSPKGLDAADAEKKAKEFAQQRKKELADLIKNGNDALSLNLFVPAEDFFKKALDKAPGDADATKGLLAARAGSAQADLDQRYKNLLDAARSSLAAGRYADAVRDAMAAQQVMPANGKAVGDALEVRQQAEQQLTMLKDQDERKQAYAKVMDQGAAAMRERRFPDAVESFKLALKLVPDDPLAGKGLADATAGTKQLMAEFEILKNQYQALMTQGTLAMNAGLFADAVLVFGQAVTLVPNDPAAQAALLNAQGALNRTAAYRAAMERAGIAMFQKQYADAMLAYSDALLNVPNDPLATQGQLDARQLLLGAMQARQIVDVKLQQAALRLQKLEYAAARDQYLDAAQFMPDHPNILITKNLAFFADKMAQGQANSKARRFGEAVVNYFEALTFANNDPFALQGLKQAMDDGQKTYNDSMDKGKKALDAKNFPDAVAGYNSALLSLPNNPLIDAQYPALPGFRDAAQQGLGDAQRLGKARYDDDMAKGILAMNARSYAEAVALYTDALRIIPNDPPAQQGLNDAQRFLQTARDVKVADLAKDFVARVNLAEQLLSLQKYAEAGKAFGEAIQMQPKDPQVAILQLKVSFANAMVNGQSAMASKRYPDALAAFTSALNALPTDAFALQRKSDAQKMIDGIGLANGFDSKVKQAEALVKTQNYDQAAKLFADAINSLPGDPKANALQPRLAYAAAMAKGRLAIGSKSYADAVLAFNDALTAAPGDVPATQGLQQAQQQVQGANLAKGFTDKVRHGDQFLGEHKYSEASLAFKEALKLQPANPQAASLQKKASYADAMAQGQLALNLKNLAGAVAAYAQAVQNAPPGDNTAQMALQRVQQQQAQAGGVAAKQNFDNSVNQGNLALAQQQYTAAATAFNNALKALPADPTAAQVQKLANYANAMANGQSAMSVKNFAGAATAYTQAVQNAPPGDNTAQLALQRAQQQQAQGGTPAPVPAPANQAHQDFDAKLKYGSQMLALHRYAEASKAYSDAVRILPGDPKTRYADFMAKGTAAMSVKNHKDAVRQFQFAVNENPGDQAAMMALKHAQKTR